MNRKSPAPRLVAKIAECRVDQRHESPFAAGELSYYPSVLTRVILPTSRQQGSSYQRKQGDMRITVMTPPPFEIPYGAHPRGIVALLAQQATLKKHMGEEDPRNIILGRNVTEFYRELTGSAWATGGVRGSISVLRRQLRSLIRSRIDIDQYDPKSGQGFTPYVHYNITDMGHPINAPLLLGDDDPKPDADLLIRLGETFYNDIIEHSVPLDNRVLKALWPNCLRMDLATWLSYRANALKDGVLRLTWNQLREQFGPDYAASGASFRVFKQRFREAFCAVQQVYSDDPDCIRLDEVGDSVLLRARYPMVQRLDTKALDAMAFKIERRRDTARKRLTASKTKAPYVEGLAGMNGWLEAKPNGTLF